LTAAERRGYQEKYRAKQRDVAPIICYKIDKSEPDWH
jgi:hypothetical protein